MSESHDIELLGADPVSDCAAAITNALLADEMIKGDPDIVCDVHGLIQDYLLPLLASAREEGAREMRGRIHDVIDAGWANDIPSYGDLYRAIEALPTIKEG